MKFLIRMNADCSLTNDQNQTALEVARRHGISSEDLVDCFSKMTTPPPMNAKLKDGVAGEKRKGRFLIEKLINFPKQWLSSGTEEVKDDAPEPQSNVNSNFVPRFTRKL